MNNRQKWSKSVSRVVIRNILRGIIKKWRIIKRWEELNSAETRVFEPDFRLEPHFVDTEKVETPICGHRKSMG
jgi:hypothetical protein